MSTETTILDLALSGDPTVLLDLDNIHPHHFADTRNAAIWRLIEDHKAKNPGQGVTRELILDKLPSITEAHVTPDYLLDIMDLTLISHRGLAGVYANKLIDDTARRHLADACTRGLQIIESGGDPSDAEASIRELLNQVSTGSTTLVNNDTCLTQITDFTTKATPFTPTPWPDLNQIIGGWKPGGLYVIAARPGVGKALALDTPIPTPTGWTTMGDIKVGDKVLGLDGKPTTVTFATDVMHDHTCYNVTFNDGETIVADADHRWVTETRASRKAACAEKKYAHASPHARRQRQHYPSVVTTKQIAETVRTKDGRANHTLPDVKPLQLPKQDLPIDPYLLGYWLGDGTSTANQITSWKEDAHHIINRINETGYHYTTQEDHSCLRITFSKTPVGSRTGSTKTDLRNLNLLKNKHIPNSYLRSSIEQRTQLLQGLLDSDGYVSKNGTVQYCTVDEQLAHGVLELARTLGIRPTMSTKAVKGRDEAHSTAYTITGTFTRDHLTLPRKRDRVPEKRRNLHRLIVDCTPTNSVPVRCIQVDNHDHMYLAGTTMVPTHNTMIALQAAAELADTGHVYFASLEMGGRELWSRIMANIANVPGDAVTRRRHPTPDEQARMTAAAPHLRQLPIHFDDRANLTIGDFVATTRLLHRQHGLTAAFIDYIGLINAAPGDRRARWELIGEYTRTLKNLAKDLQIPIFAIAQLGRQAEQSPGGELQLSHLRESGNIEQDANVVLLLSCPHEGGVTDWTRADIHVAKNREGRTGHVLLEREGDYSRLNHLGWAPRA